ncbi:hypothetical protein Patl1_28492 [Pistacia atlantica]|uniref:Uncharacterized protein n=1 Tax=Pistacia atlantica TaxID=434234 RepID=A0ACC1BDH6_9ROSI|nr:hypothetical protein Patl1_28492 [Pistacia atlantica]
MRREEKRRKFHEAVLNTLYPPSSPPQAVDEEEKPGHPLEDFDVELINLDDFVRTGSSSDGGDDVDDNNGEGGECEPQKLSRAQRKRLRKKKLKEDASGRSKIIGPLLPTTKKRTKTIMMVEMKFNNQVFDKMSIRNVRLQKTSLVGCSKQKKLKNRRLAKRVAKEQLKLSSGSEKVDEGQSFESSNNRGNCDNDHSSMENSDQAQAS